MDNKPDTYDLSLNLNKAQSPDSGIDMSKFNIVDFILDDGCDWDTNMTVVEPTGINAITTVTAPQGSPSVSTSPSGPENAEAETISVTSSQSQSLSQSQSQNQSVRNLPLRTSSKQELQRQKAIEESKREQQVKAAIQPPPQSNPVDLPAILSSSPQLPKELLFVETRLENPTPYHLKQCFRNKITQFAMENGAHKGSSVPPPATYVCPQMDPHLSVAAAHHHQPGSAPPNIFAPSPVPPAASPLPPGSSVGTSVTSGCSDVPVGGGGLDVESELNMFSLSDIDAIISQDDGAGTDIFSFSTPSVNFLQSPQSQPTSASTTPSQRGKGGTGTGTPNNTTPTQSLPNGTPLQSPGTPDDARAAKDRQKKDNHNKIERRRRYLINDMITLQGQQLPKPNEPYYEKFGDVKQNKGAILQASVDYIQILKDENEAFRQKDVKSQLKLKQAEQERRKLLLRIKELEDLCGRSGINIPEESLTWKPPRPDKIDSIISEPIVIKQEPRFCELMDEGLVSGDPMLGSVGDFVNEDVGMELS